MSDMLLHFKTRAHQRPNVALNKSGEGWAKLPSQYLAQTSPLPKHGFDFRYVTPFQNQNALEATGVKNLGKISHFFTSC